MRTDLETPCKHCPFRSDETAIRFADEMRALEILLTAQEHGFPCHLSANYVEEVGFCPHPEAQLCVGSSILFLKMGYLYWNAVDREIAAALREQVDFSAPVFDTQDAFLAASRR